MNDGNQPRDGGYKPKTPTEGNPRDGGYKPKPPGSNGDSQPRDGI
jgi:hypothetical protein